MQVTAGYVSERLATQAESIARELMPNGKSVGTDWVVGSLDGEAGKSLHIHLSGEHAGRWKDWATGDGGDMLDLLAQVRGIDIGAAIDEACKFLGIVRTRLDSEHRKTYKKPERPAVREPVSSSARVAAFFAQRHISQDTLDAYKVIASGSAAVFPFFRGDDVVHIQYRDVDEKRFWASDGTEMILFGWQAVDRRARAIIITEGPMDALAWYEYGYDAMSVPNGAGGNGKQGRWIEREFHNLERFDKIYICMDKDKEGEDATAAIVNQLGRHRCFVVSVPDPHKDANDCLMAGVPQQIMDQCIKNARTMDPGELRNASYFADEVVEFFNPVKRKIAGFAPPWHILAPDLTFGFGQTTMLAGWNGCGKTTAIGQITLDATRQGIRACVASLEFKPHTYFAWLVRQAMCKSNPEEMEVRRALSHIAENLWAFSAYGAAKLDNILDVWRYAHARYGCKLFVLDNFSKLDISGKNDDNNLAQGAAITHITEFAVNTDSHVLVAAHSRKKFNEHEEVGKLDIKGAGTLTDLVDIVLLMHRNKKKERAMIDRAVFAELPIEEQGNIRNRPDAYLTCEKNRHGEVEPRLPLWFDRGSHQFVDQQRGVPMRYDGAIPMRTQNG